MCARIGHNCGTQYRTVLIVLLSSNHHCSDVAYILEERSLVRLVMTTISTVQRGKISWESVESLYGFTENAQDCKMTDKVCAMFICVQHFQSVVVSGNSPCAKTKAKRVKAKLPDLHAHNIDYLRYNFAAHDWSKCLSVWRRSHLVQALTGVAYVTTETVLYAPTLWRPSSCY